MPPELLSAALRAATYVGTIAAAGGVLFTLLFPRASEALDGAVWRQITTGCTLLLLVEPMRVLAFQLAIAGGDLAGAFGPDLRWMAFETGMGRAAAARWLAAAILAGCSRRSTGLGLAAASVMIGSFAAEGHSTDEGLPAPLAPIAVLVHLGAVHWWLGALPPLLSLTRMATPQLLAETIGTFGRRGVWVVAGLAVAGLLLLGLLTGARPDAANPYQQRFAVKLLLVAGLLAIAASNKLRLTPLLMRDDRAGRTRLAASIRVEILVAACVLAATAWATATSPEG